MEVTVIRSSVTIFIKRYPPNIHLLCHVFPSSKIGKMYSFTQFTNSVIVSDRLVDKMRKKQIKLYCQKNMF